METTSVSLLERLRRPDEPAAWGRFVDLYTPLIYHWARGAGLQPADAADLAQEVFAALLRQLPLFHYDPGRSFRGWLRTVTLNKWRERQRRRAPATLDDPDRALAVPADGDDGPDALGEAEYRRHLSRRALALMQAEFPPAAWKACWEVVVSGRPPAEVAAELGITVGAVYTAKSRILRRLREELAGLID